MWKFVPIIVAILIMVGLIVYVRVVVFNANSHQDTGNVLQDVTSGQTLSSNAPLTDRVSKIELVLVEIAQQIQNLKNQVSTLQGQNQQAIPANLDSRLQLLETTVADLNSHVSVLEGTPVPQSTSTVSTTHSVVYMPLWGSGSVTSSTWSTDYNSYDITIDPGDYPGYTSMQLQVELESYQGSGTSYAELQNTTDGTSVLSSLVSTSSYYYTLATSSTFTLPSKGTYRLALKNNTGYQTLFQNARLKINY